MNNTSVLAELLFQGGTIVLTVRKSLPKHQPELPG
jgi:hypothetical protein